MMSITPFTAGIVPMSPIVIAESSASFTGPPINHLEQSYYSLAQNFAVTASMQWSLGSGRKIGGGCDHIDLPPSGGGGNAGDGNGPRRKKGFPSKLLAELQQSRLVTNEIGFFNSLKPLDRDTFERLRLDCASVTNASREFSFRTEKGKAIHIDLHFFQTDLAPQPNIVVYGRFITDAEELLGIWATTVFVDEEKKRGSEIVVVEKDMQRLDLRGFGNAFIAFYNQFNRVFNLDYEFIRAAWLGRKVWTRLGTLEYDAQYTFLAGEEAMSQLDLTVKNLWRFLRFHQIRPGSVGYVDDGGNWIPLQEAVAGGAISKPADFLRVVGREGAQLSIPALIDYQILETPRPRDIGEAFVLADCRPYSGQQMNVRFVKNGVPLSDGDVWPPNNRFSDRAMPPWVGIRRFRQN